MSTLAHIFIVELGRHLEWFLELAPVKYIMLHILYIIIKFKIKYTYILKEKYFRLMIPNSGY